MSLVLDVNGLSIRMAHSLRKTPTYEAEAGVFLLAESPLVPAPYSGETDGVVMVASAGGTSEDIAVRTNPRRS
jgi:hypothetical protein